MMNEHVVHLATIARIGTQVRVVNSYPAANESAPLFSLFSGFGSPEPTADEAKKKR
jgi:hypothetical protein